MFGMSVRGWAGGNDPPDRSWRCSLPHCSRSSQAAVEVTAKRRSQSRRPRSSLPPIPGEPSASTRALEASAGTITIELANESSIPHNVAIEGGGDEESPTVTGESTSLTVDLQPGTYTFYCSVPGHREGGMEGTLTVR
jgi:hypothetical protein